tara:strand:- start:1002 stop:2528 length:1527 start_codon:yes stop_codon:yes gene_type:complete
MTEANISQEESFSKFGKAFQEKLGRAILEDRSFSNQMVEVLDIGYLELKYLQAFVQLIFSYKDKYSVHPTFDTLVSVIRTEMEDYPDVIKKQVIEYLSKIKSGQINADDRDYVKEKSLDFCKKQKLKEAILKSVNLLQTSSFEEIQKVIDGALNLGLDDSHGHDFVQDFEARYVKISRDPSMTGWQEIDNITRGGLGKRELGVVIAPTGAGKSMALVHLGAMAVLSGKNVIHYTLELAEGVVGQRYDSCLTGVPLSNLFDHKDKIKEKISQVDGQLIIKEYPTKSATTMTLETSLEKMRQRGIEPDFIIVDYADLLRPVTTSYKQEHRHNIETIYEELRGIAQKFDIPVWTASQTNRSGLNAEVITMESISEAFNKCFVADFICTISRTADDKVQGTGRMFVAKNRNGPDGLVFPMSIDTSKVKLRVHQPQAGDDLNTIVTRTAQEQKQHLQQKYKKFKQKRKTETNTTTNNQERDPLSNPLSKESLRKLAEETRANKEAQNRSAAQQ